MPFFIITQTMCGAPDSHGRRSHDNEVIGPDGRRHVQTFFAKPEKTLARLRHNIAAQFWFNRMRVRLAREMATNAARTP
jgi:hypothetical protein